MTPDDQCAVYAAYRYFAAHLIVSSIDIIRNQRSALCDVYYAREFLRSETCIYFVRLLGMGDGMSDAEIARMLREAQMRKQ